MKASTGLVRDSPASEFDLLDRLAVAAHGQDAGEGAERHGDVDEQVDDHALHAGLRAGGKPDQREAHVADGGIGHQPLDVGLADGGEGAEHHRGNGDEGDDLLPVVDDAREGTGEHPDEQRHRGDLGRGGKEGGDRGWRAFVDVGRPHVERHGRDLEGQPSDQEDETERQAEGGLTSGERRRDAGEARLAGEAIDEGSAVEQHPRRQGAQHEILEPRLGRAQRIPVDGGKHVDRQRLHLQPKIERDEIGGRDHHHHAERRQYDQHRILEAFELLGAHEADRHGDGDARADQRHDLQEPRERIEREGTVEGGTVAGSDNQDRPDHHDERHGKVGDRGRRALTSEHADHEQRQRADRHHDLGQGWLIDDVDDHAPRPLTARPRWRGCRRRKAPRGSCRSGCRPRRQSHS